MLVLAATSAVLLNHVSLHMRATNSERDKVFAMAKAGAILNEMQSYVEQALPGGRRFAKLHQIAMHIAQIVERIFVTIIVGQG